MLDSRILLLDQVLLLAYILMLYHRTWDGLLRMLLRLLLDALLNDVVWLPVLLLLLLGRWMPLSVTLNSVTLRPVLSC